MFLIRISSGVYPWVLGVMAATASTTLLKAYNCSTGIPIHLLASAMHRLVVDLHNHRNTDCSRTLHVGRISHSDTDDDGFLIFLYHDIYN